MAREPAGSLLFVDADSDDEVYAAIRVDGDRIHLALSLRSNGDVEVSLRRDECARLVEALQQAILVAKRG